MRTSSALILFALLPFTMSAAIPKRSNDADAAVVYPASIDLSWVDDQKEKRTALDADEGVVYPASVDLSWVNGKN